MKRKTIMDGKEELSIATLRDIERAEKEIKEGKVVSFGQIKKKLEMI